MQENSTLRNLSWIEEKLPHDILMIPKHGGQAYYLDEHLVLILVEHAKKTYEHKGVTYPFDLWNGCIFPVLYKYQSAFFRKYLFLENNPFCKDWLYIPAESEHFEEEVKQMLREIWRRNVLLGIPIKTRSPAKAKAADSKKSSNKQPKTSKKKENSFILSLTKRKNNTVS
jgi:hypothetical protein